MNIIGTIIFILLVIAVVLTFMSEPKVSFEYYKAMGVSGKKMITFIKDKVSDFMDDKPKEVNKNESINT